MESEMAKKTTVTDAATLLDAPVDAPVAPRVVKEQKTSSITLLGPADSTLYLLAERKPDGATTTVTRTVDKKAERGMTKVHASFADAKKHIATLADQAVKLGWKRKAAWRGFTAKPDAFSDIPAPPKGKK
jgi:hypothetical protein